MDSWSLAIQISKISLIWFAGLPVWSVGLVYRGFGHFSASQAGRLAEKQVDQTGRPTKPAKPGKPA